jgi:hypothetical protein
MYHSFQFLIHFKKLISCRFYSHRSTNSLLLTNCLNYLNFISELYFQNNHQRQRLAVPLFNCNLMFTVSSVPKYLGHSFFFHRPNLKRIWNTSLRFEFLAPRLPLLELYRKTAVVRKCLFNLRTNIRTYKHTNLTRSVYESPFNTGKKLFRKKMVLCLKKCYSKKI